MSGTRDEQGPPQRPGRTIADDAPPAPGAPVGPFRTLMDAPPPAPADADVPESVLQRYTLLDWKRFRSQGKPVDAAVVDDAVIGAGGMGRVLLALDERMGRVVAIKEQLGPPEHRRAAARRFLREARVTGALEHPGIVPVHELGEQRDGSLFYTMRLVRGRSLGDALHQADSLRERLSLLPHVVDLCHAVAFAHSQGVIHRDLKPDNVMVGEFGETVVLDWGLARGLRGEAPGDDGPSRAELAGATSPGHTQGVMGTPAFMSPEQAWGVPEEVDEASDVWALGAILYTLLTGTLPVPGRNADEAIDWLRDDGNRVEPVRVRCPDAPRELASVAMACLERHKGRRMGGAQRIAREIQRWQAGERVVSHRYSVWELGSHIVNRNRPLSVAVGVAAAVALAAVGFSVTAYRARREAETLSRQHAFEQLLLAREALDGQRPLEAQARLRASLEALDTPLARALWARIQSTPLLMRSKLATEVTGLAFSNDGAQLAAASASPDLTLLDSWTGARWTLTGPGRNLYVVAWSPDGHSLAAGSGGGQVVLWRDLNQPPTLFEGHSDIVSAVSFDATGQRILSGSFDGTAKLWDLDGTQLGNFEGHEGPITAVAWSPDQASFATASADQSVRSWDLRSGETSAVMAGHEGEVTGLAYLEDGRVLVSVGHDGSLRSWDASSGEPLELHSDSSAQYMNLSVASSGRILAAADHRGRLHLWSPPHLAGARVLEGDGAMSFALALTRDGARLASGGVSRSVSLWNAAAAGRRPDMPGHEGAVTAVDTFPEGQRIASAGWDGRVRIWGLDGAQLSSWRAHDESIEALRVAPDGEHLATGAADHSVRIHEVATGRLVRLLTGHYGSVQGLAYSPDGAWLASAGDGGMVYLWDLVSGERRTILDERSPTAVGFGPTGDRLAVAWSRGEEGHLRVLGLPGGEVVFERVVPGLELAQVAFGPLGRSLYGVARDGRVLGWDLSGGEVTAPLQLEGRGRAVAVHPDGRWVAASSTGSSLAVVDAPTGSAVSLSGHRGTVEELAFDATGTLLVSAGFDGTVRTWDPLTGHPIWRGTLLPLQGVRCGHGGWRSLAGTPVADPGTAWSRAVALDARLSVEASEGGGLCLQTWAGDVQQWDLEADERRASAPLPRAASLVATPDSCAVLDSSGAVGLLRAEGLESLQVEVGTSAMGPGVQAFTLAGPGWVRSYDAAGTELSLSPQPFDEPSAVAGLPDALAVGDQHGAVAVITVRRDGGQRIVQLQDTPRSGVTSLAGGAMRTVAVGFVDGTVGLWDSRSGTRLFARRLHGAVEHLAFGNHHLYAMSELGASTSIDLSALELQRCHLLHDIWDRVPVCWDGGAEPCEPPADHACAEGASGARPR